MTNSLNSSDRSMDVTKEATKLGQFGMTSAVCLVIANMIGAGVFTTSGFALADLGSRWQVLGAWFVAGIIALCGAISYGGLAKHIAGSGGEYLFLSRTVHPLAGFLAGWVSLFAGFTGPIAYAARTFEVYASSLLPPILADLPDGSVAIATIVLCGVLHSLALRPGLAAQNLLVLIKLSVLVGFIAFAFLLFAAGEWDGWKVTGPEHVKFSLSTFAQSLVWISFSFSGFNAAVYVAGEVADAERTVPRALWIATLVTWGLYLLLNFVFLFAALPDAIIGTNDVAVVAANAMGRGALTSCIRVVISLAMLSSVSSMIVAGPRVYSQMAKDGVFPSWLQMKGGTPMTAIWLQSGLAILVVMATKLEQLLGYLSLTLSLSAAATVACLFVIRRRQGADAITIPGYPMVPLVFVAATVGLGLLSTGQSPAPFIAMVITLLAGVAVYLWFRKGEQSSSS